ncbi:hypothetical protein DdX_19356 [Ditylenchus destructor]|uniref:Uncharacterized protein n=1 Tax=Ditylenchus destructor TaxID=166010 RepID=A0AAD4MI44_9BILA|nr:hypothetical protein DdX_19356 [Ditylenchus destructor]
MQAYNFHGAQYFFFLIFLCTSNASLAYISPFYFRIKPYMSFSTLEQSSPDVIERELPKMESVETNWDIPAAKEPPLRTMELLTIPYSLGKYFGHMPIAAIEISQTNDFQNLLTRSRQKSLERQAEKTATARPSRRRYDHNCFFTPINCRPWIGPSIGI